VPTPVNCALGLQRAAKVPPKPPSKSTQQPQAETRRGWHAAGSGGGPEATTQLRVRRKLDLSLLNGRRVAVTMAVYFWQASCATAAAARRGGGRPRGGAEIWPPILALQEAAELTKLA
jgi:hypothetical protein